MSDIVKIAISGGPCSGKSTGIPFVVNKLSEYGYRVHVVPETATLIITNSVPDIETLSRKQRRIYQEIQRTMIGMQNDLENRHENIARLFPHDEKQVIICDRGMMDFAAYMSKRAFVQGLFDVGLTESQALQRYDALIFMETAAKQVPEYYTQTNNKARRETPTKAIRANDRTCECWLGHNHFKMVGGEKSFDAKLNRLLQSVCRVIGIPAPLEIERKFLVKRMPKLSSLPSYQVVEITQHYLRVPMDEENLDDDHQQLRIRKRVHHDHATYYRTEKVRISDLVRQEIEQKISRETYCSLKSFCDPTRKPIRKRRYCFTYNNQHFELDEFQNPPSLCLLEIELTEENDEVTLPPFLKVVREVTGDPHFSNRHLAKK